MMPIVVVAEIACYQNPNNPHVAGVAFVIYDENERVLQTYKRRIYQSSLLGDTALLIRTIEQAVISASAFGASRLLLRTDSIAIIHLCRNNARNLPHLQKKLTYFQMSSVETQATLTSSLEKAMQLARAAAQRRIPQSSKHLTQLRC